MSLGSFPTRHLHQLFLCCIGGNTNKSKKKGQKMEQRSLLLMACCNMCKNIHRTSLALAQHVVPKAFLNCTPIYPRKLGWMVVIFNAVADRFWYSGDVCKPADLCVGYFSAVQLLLMHLFSIDIPVGSSRHWWHGLLAKRTNYLRVILTKSLLLL